METPEADIERMKECLGKIEGKRRQAGNFQHLLIDILVIGLCSAVIGRDEFEETEEFGHLQEGRFRKFLELPAGIPDEYTFKRVFEMMEPKKLQKALAEWVEMTGEHRGREVNIDGKTICGSAGGKRSAVHVASAWVWMDFTPTGRHG